LLWRLEGNDTSLFIDEIQVANKKWLSPPKNVIRKECQIGGSHDGIRNMIGIIDDVRIYNRSLSSSEISQLYELEKP